MKTRVCPITPKNIIKTSQNNLQTTPKRPRYYPATAHKPPKINTFPKIAFSAPTFYLYSDLTTKKER